MSPQEFEQGLHDAEVKLARLKALYEQWFQGIEKLEPSVPRKDLDRFLDILKRNVPRNTALRFRMQQLVARYGTYVIYWQRIARQIEEGTLHRDIVKARRKQQTTQKKALEQAFELDVDVDLDMNDLADEPKPPPSTLLPRVPPRPSDLDAILGTLAPPEGDPNKGRSARPLSPFAMARATPAASATFGKPKDKPASAAATVAMPSAMPAPISVVATKPVIAPPKPAVAPPVAARAVVPPPVAPKPMAPAVPKPAAVAPAVIPKPAVPPPRSAGELDDGQMRAIYSRYVDARKQNNERADVRYEALAESVQKMMPKLREKHAGKAIDFEVVLQNGKVGLKPKVGG